MAQRFIRASMVSFVFAAIAFVGCGGTEPPPEHPNKKKEAKKEEPIESCDPKVGERAPALHAKAADGNGRVTLPTGKVTIVDFWATWCPPCEASFPKYQELYVKYKTSGLEIVAVAMDEEVGKVQPYVKAHGAKFPVGWDEGQKLAKCWKPSSMPTMYIIDKRGVVRFIHREWHPGDEKEVEKQIKALL
jgi:cytochrome c biogenesis protein CcmG, thiol:disulfide interchange protein DsbE